MSNVELLTKMYYVPVVYYWINNDDVYKNVKLELKDSLDITKDKFYNKQSRIKQSISPSDNKHILLIEKTPEYNEYKSNLIRLILIDHAHFYPDETGKKLLDKIFKKWKNNFFE
jgi:hypothetical protein